MAQCGALLRARRRRVDDDHRPSALFQPAQLRHKVRVRRDQDGDGARARGQDRHVPLEARDELAVGVLSLARREHLLHPRAVERLAQLPAHAVRIEEGGDQAIHARAPVAERFQPLLERLHGLERVDTSGYAHVLNVPKNSRVPPLAGRRRTPHRSLAAAARATAATATDRRRRLWWTGVLGALRKLLEMARAHHVAESDKVRVLRKL
eukprot:6310178-Prymnesium_polylepis.1